MSEKQFRPAIKYDSITNGYYVRDSKGVVINIPSSVIDKFVDQVILERKADVGYKVFLVVHRSDYIEKAFKHVEHAERYINKQSQPESYRIVEKVVQQMEILERGEE